MLTTMTPSDMELADLAGGPFFGSERLVDAATVAAPPRFRLAPPGGAAAGLAAILR